MLSPSQVIVIATPVFFLLIAIEWLVSMRRRNYPYKLADAFSSMSLGLMSQTSAVFTKLLTVGIYTAVFEHVALLRSDAFWLSIPGWLIALVLYALLHEIYANWEDFAEADKPVNMTVYKSKSGTAVENENEVSFTIRFTTSVVTENVKSE